MDRSATALPDASRKSGYKTGMVDGTRRRTERMLNRAIEQRAPFHQGNVPFICLKEIHGEWMNALNPINVASVIPAMHLARKVTVIAPQLECGPDYIRESIGLCGVKDLSIRMDVFDFRYMDLMRACKRLDAVSIVLKNGFGDYIFPQVREFRRPKDTLRKLVFLWFEDGWSTQNRVFGCLADFPVLTEVHIRGVNLVRYNLSSLDEDEDEDEDDEPDVPFLVKNDMLDNLPPNLTVLRVDDVTHYRETDVLVSNLVRLVKSNRFPHLRVLEIGGKFIRHRSPKPRVHRPAYLTGSWLNESDRRNEWEPLCQGCREAPVMLRIYDPIIDPGLIGGRNSFH